ncbi:hypothetical protein ACJ72_08129 [Emergomyces africanus]|uniref:Mannosyltransferase n=1 Tax=Emergomyces africanus TaxID=1955775 RepID=A0A1B7NL57_9EURO|nr:hypothetical protein ACJ72_08129 [Emergomyces africanus]
MLTRHFRALVTVCLLLLAFFSFNALRRSSPIRIYVLPSPIEAQSLRARQIKFWQTLLPILQKNVPECPSPHRDGNAEAVGFNAADPPTRPSLISMPGADVLKMQQAHTSFLQQAKTLPDLKPVFIARTRGVVYTAGGPYLPVLVSSLRMLRRTGSNLPVELFLKDRTEYESSICDELIPSLNGRCVVLSDILGPAAAAPRPPGSGGDSPDGDGNQTPKHLDSNPFQLTGMVTWPDFWISTVSSLYYNISQQPIPSMGLRASSETGQILLSKKSHPTTLLLSAYYNYYGPSHYFPLLSQGAPGEGDKETFLQAASAAGEPFYATNEAVRAIGHVKGDDNNDGSDIAGSAMVQFDPADEYRNYHLSLINQHNKNKNHKHNMINITPPPRVSFIHAHFPKFNPATIFDPSHETKPTYRTDGSDGRAWLAPRDTLARFGYDVERAFWEEILWVACELKAMFRSWEGLEGICERVQRYWGNVFGGEAGDVDGVLGIGGRVKKKDRK